MTTRKPVPIDAIQSVLNAHRREETPAPYTREAVIAKYQSRKRSDRRAWSVVEIAKLLGRHKATVYRLIYSGKLKTIASNTGDILIADEELRKFLSARKA